MSTVDQWVWVTLEGGGHVQTIMPIGSACMQYGKADALQE